MERSTFRDGNLVFPGKYLRGMEEQVNHVFVVGPWETCAILFFDTLKGPDLLDHRSGLREERPLVRGSLSG